MIGVHHHGVVVVDDVAHCRVIVSGAICTIRVRIAVIIV